MCAVVYKPAVNGKKDLRSVTVVISFFLKTGNLTITHLVVQAEQSNVGLKGLQKFSDAADLTIKTTYYVHKQLQLLESSKGEINRSEHDSPIRNRRRLNATLYIKKAAKLIDRY